MFRRGKHIIISSACYRTPYHWYSWYPPLYILYLSIYIPVPVFWMFCSVGGRGSPAGCFPPCGVSPRGVWGLLPLRFLCRA